MGHDLNVDMDYQITLNHVRNIFWIWKVWKTDEEAKYLCLDKDHAVYKMVSIKINGLDDEHPPTWQQGIQHIQSNNLTAAPVLDG